MGAVQSSVATHKERVDSLQVVARYQLLQLGFKTSFEWHPMNMKIFLGDQGTCRLRKSHQKWETNNYVEPAGVAYLSSIDQALPQIGFLGLIL
jgi:hypothetical protein